MSIFDSGLGNLVPIFWVVTLFLLIRLALRRIQPSIDIDEWEYQTKVGQIRQRPNMITLLKIYQTLRKSNSREMAIHIRDELTGNAAIAFDKPNAYFVKNRLNPTVMRQYIKDEELLAFFSDPKRWAIHNGGTQSKFFGLIHQEVEDSPEFFDHISRILMKFEKELVGIHNVSQTTQQ